MLELHYQPKVDVVTGRLVGVEALARIRDPAGAIRPPAEFLAEVESGGTRRAFTDAVLEQAGAQAAAWRNSHGLIPIAVNLFAANLEEPDLSDRVLRAMAHHRLPIAALTLEVTETAVIADEPRAATTLRTLTDAGARLSIDDFGTGHSSLLRLASFPFTEVKIDRQFVSTMRRSERPILAALFEMGRTLGLSLVAEGVEDLATVNALRAVGCETIQGHYVARPMPAAEFECWLAGEQPKLSPAVEVRDALVRVRRQLAMDAAFVSEFDASDQVYRIVDGDAETGTRVPLCDSYCQRVVHGVFPGLIADARHDPRTRDLPITERAGVGSYIGVPLRRADGSLFGTLCCIARSPRPNLGRADYRLIEEVAEELRPYLEEANFAFSGRGESAELAAPTGRFGWEPRRAAPEEAPG